MKWLVGLFVVASIALALIAWPAPNTPGPDRFYALERERISTEYAQLGLEEARWASQARQMAWEQQLTAPPQVVVEPQEASVPAPAPAPISASFLLIAGLWGAILTLGGVLVAVVLLRRPESLAALPLRALPAPPAHCPRCAWPLSHDARFCTACGASVVSDGATVRLREVRRG